MLVSVQSHSRSKLDSSRAGVLTSDLGGNEVRQGSRHPLTSLRATAVQPAIKSDRRRKEPGAPEIIRTTLKGDLVERGSPLTFAENLLAEPHAEIARHRNAGTSIAHRKMDPVSAANMGQLVECISDEAHPGAADSHGSEFRE